MNSYSADELNARLPYAFGTELDWFRTTAKSFTETTRVVMLGAGPGVMALALLEGCPKFKFTVVDNYSYESAQTHIIAAGHDVSTVRFVLANSWEYAALVEEPVDLLIIDADHSFASVCKDFIGWLRHLRPGSKVFFHDVVDLEQNGTNGVRQAIDVLIEYGYKLRLVEQVGISEVYEIYD